MLTKTSQQWSPRNLWSAPDSAFSARKIRTYSDNCPRVNSGADLTVPKIWQGQVLISQLINGLNLNYNLNPNANPNRNPNYSNEIGYNNKP